MFTSKQVRSLGKLLVALVAVWTVLWAGFSVAAPCIYQYAEGAENDCRVADIVCNPGCVAAVSTACTGHYYDYTNEITRQVAEGGSEKIVNWGFVICYRKYVCEATEFNLDFRCDNSTVCIPNQEGYYCKRCNASGMNIEIEDHYWAALGPCGS
jgi:hypothetical protein